MISKFHFVSDKGSSGDTYDISPFTEHDFEFAEQLKFKGFRNKNGMRKMNVLKNTWNR